jgi:hypothetical protein
MLKTDQAKQMTAAKRLFTLYRPTRCNIPENLYLHQHDCVKIRSRNLKGFVGLSITIVQEVTHSPLLTGIFRCKPVNTVRVRCSAGLNCHCRPAPRVQFL